MACHDAVHADGRAEVDRLPECEPFTALEGTTCSLGAGRLSLDIK